MAIRAYLATLVSSIQAPKSIEEKHKCLIFTKATLKVVENNGGVGEGRRLLLLLTVVTAATHSKTWFLNDAKLEAKKPKTQNSLDDPSSKCSVMRLQIIFNRIKEGKKQEDCESTELLITCCFREILDMAHQENKKALCLFTKRTDLRSLLVALPKRQMATP
ncbi:hypothetical protein Tco_0058848 [Tanacetum coccineum]